MARRRPVVEEMGDVPARLCVFRLADWSAARDPDGLEGHLCASRRWSAARAGWLRERGLPAGWWSFWDWSPEAQRRFLAAGRRPPPGRQR